MIPKLDDVLQFLVSYLRRSGSTSELPSYGYEVYLPNVRRAFALEVEKVNRSEPGTLDHRAKEIGTVFYDAAWELCRRGILRPGRLSNGQVTDEGADCEGYSITSRGRQWLKETEGAPFIPLEPVRFAELVGKFRSTFGDGYHQRAQEAVKCHFSTAYLGCCVMCGAAAESILLHLAIAREGDEEKVLAAYKTSGGRGRVEKTVTHGVPTRVADQFANLLDLLKYWRDDASHGTSTEISEFEAYEALARLLRLAHFSSDHLAELTGK